MTTLSSITLIEFIVLIVSCFFSQSAAFLLGRAPPPFSARSLHQHFAQPLPSMETNHDSSLQELNQETLFLRNAKVDTTIQNLQSQLPQLLVKPLTDQDASEVYSDDVTLTGPGGEELALGREELVALSSTLVAATAAVRQANAFLVSSKSNNSTMTVVDCQMAMDTNLNKIRVEWKVDLPIRIPQGVSKLVGLSDLHLNPEGQVSEHKVVRVAIDGQTISAVGETLATLRRVARTLTESPLLTGIRDSPLANTLVDIRNELLQQQQPWNGANINATTVLPVPALYLTESVDEAFTTNTTMTLMNQTTMSPPLPGSAQWKSFAASRQAVASFVEYGLPTLSGNSGVGSSRLDYSNLFSPNAQLLGVNSVLLASGGERIANFYRTIASLRKGGDWNIINVTTDWNSSSVEVKWKATSPIIRVEGTDRFLLCKEETKPIIQKVQQVELKINGNRVLDPEWIRTLFTTIEAGQGTVGVGMVVDLLQQQSENVSLRKSSPGIVKAGPPKLKPEAAASFYSILCALHRDLPTLCDANPTSPPAAEFITPNIELRGYLDETLAKGSVAYTQVANVLVASLRALTGRVTAEAPPLPTIKVMPDGSIRVLLLLKLKVKVTPGESDLGAPLNLELVSDYKINDEGLIKEHKLVESRVNGQYTPGDVVSRWIKGTTTEDSESGTTASSLLDVLSWARTLSGSNNRRH